MKHAALIAFVAWSAFAQPSAPGTFAAAEQSLGWRVALPGTDRTAPPNGTAFVEITTRQLAPSASTSAVESFRSTLDRERLAALIYRVDGPVSDWPQAMRTAAKLGAHVVIAALQADQLDVAAKAAAQNSVTLALDATAGGLLDPEKALAAVRQYEKRVRLWVNPKAFEAAGTKPLPALYMLREYLGGASLESPASEEFMREAYRLDIKPLVWEVAGQDLKRVVTTLDQLVAYHQSYAARTEGIRRLAGVSPEDRTKLEAALPARAPASPRKPRKLLVFDLNVGRFGHPSIPYANLAMQLMGSKTGAFEATVTSDPAMLQPGRLKSFDAVYLNNTIGDIFSTAEAREGFAEFVRNGGGVMGNHATTVTMTDWKEFGEILGARGASHRMTDERVVIRVEDPGSPIVKGFGSAPFEYADEIFRFQPPYSRNNLRVLMSVDPSKTDMNQGRCFGQCYRDDNDYPVAWIKTYGKGRIFYTTLGHNPHVFWQPNMLQMFLAAAQYVLGDLDLDVAPTFQPSELDRVLPAVSKYDWGKDETPVRQLDRAMGLLKPGAEAAREAEQKLLSALKDSTTIGAKDAIARHLAVVGSEASVAVLAPMLRSKDTADLARYAMERIESPKATAALRSALPTTDKRSRIGIIHSLARRKDLESVPVLQGLLSSADPAIADAPANALGMIGTVDAEQALLAINLRPAIADALLTLAEQTTPARALPIYTKLSAAPNPDELRVAAFRGLIRLGATDAVAKGLKDVSPNVQTTAVVNLTPALLTAELGKLPPAIQIQGLASLTSRNDLNARAALIAASGSDNSYVRIAALEGLAVRGTAQDIPLLVKVATTATGAEQAAARTALIRLPRVDDAILSALSIAQGEARIELIRTVGERATPSAADAMLAYARHENPAIRREALRALRRIARPDMSGAILDLLVKSVDDDRKESELALADALSRADKPNLQPVVEAFEKAQDSDTRVSLINVMALTGGNDALPVLRQALGANDVAVQRAAVAGLSEWNSPEPLDDLLRIARKAPDASVRVLALRAYIRLVQRPAGRASAETAKLLGVAMSAASRSEEKKAVLAAVQRLVTPEALKIAQSAVSDPAVTAEATLAVTTLERALAARGR